MSDGLHFGNGFALNRRQVITWANDYPVKLRIYASPRVIELKIKFDYHHVKWPLNTNTQSGRFCRGLSHKIHYNTMIYLVHGTNLTLIQPMWSAYPYAPTSWYGIHMPLFPYMVIQPIVLGMALLWAAIHSALSQGQLLCRHNDMTIIVSRSTRGRERDTRQRLDNANARRWLTVNR